MCLKLAELTEKAKDEMRQLQQLGQVITRDLEGAIVEQLPHEIVFLLSILEAKERKTWTRKGMIDKAKHITAAAEALELFQRNCGTVDAHAIADLICDLGLLAEERGIDFLGEVKRGIGHWFAERHARPGNNLGPDAIVEIRVTARA